MDSNYYNHHMVDKLTRKAAQNEMSIKTLAKALNLGINRLCVIIGSDHGYVCLETRRRIQNFLGTREIPMSWEQCNAGPEETLPPLPVRRRWYTGLCKLANRLRGWTYAKMN